MAKNTQMINYLFAMNRSHKIFVQIFISCKGKRQNTHINHPSHIVVTKISRNKYICLSYIYIQISNFEHLKMNMKLN